jgi:hypothetical protein
VDLGVRLRLAFDREHVAREDQRRPFRESPIRERVEPGRGNLERSEVELTLVRREREAPLERRGRRVPLDVQVQVHRLGKPALARERDGEASIAQGSEFRREVGAPASGRGGAGPELEGLLFQRLARRVHEAAAQQELILGRRDPQDDSLARAGRPRRSRGEVRAHARHAGVGEHVAAQPDEREQHLAIDQLSRSGRSARSALVCGRLRRKQRQAGERDGRRPLDLQHHFARRRHHQRDELPRGTREVQRHFDRRNQRLRQRDRVAVRVIPRRREDRRHVVEPRESCGVRPCLRVLPSDPGAHSHANGDPRARDRLAGLLDHERRDGPVRLQRKKAGETGAFLELHVTPQSGRSRHDAHALAALGNEEAPLDVGENRHATFLEQPVELTPPQGGGTRRFRSFVDGAERDPRQFRLRYAPFVRARDRNQLELAAWPVVFVRRHELGRNVLARSICVTQVLARRGELWLVRRLRTARTRLDARRRETRSTSRHPPPRAEKAREENERQRELRAHAWEDVGIGAASAGLASGAGRVSMRITPVARSRRREAEVQVTRALPRAPCRGLPASSGSRARARPRWRRALRRARSRRAARPLR